MFSSSRTNRKYTCIWYDYFMLVREYWINRIQKAWSKKNVIWLAGIRRVGKTSLVKSLEQIEYFDCELPSARKIIESDIEYFLKQYDGKNIVIDEIHRLSNPAELLKIAADYYPQTKIIATGSSTLAASKKFKDTLTDRKVVIKIVPMIDSELESFAKELDIKGDPILHRLLFGGLPGFFLRSEIDEYQFNEWMESFWAKDIEELYNIDKKYSFIKFMELIMSHSGKGVFEATNFSSVCEISRTSIYSYLQVLEETFIVSVLRPYNKRREGEIVSAPKVYAMDTGFVCHYHGWRNLTDDNLGILWEHYVLNELKAYFPDQEIKYWRHKNKSEVDFILEFRNKLIAIEAKWQDKNDHDLNGLLALRKLDSDGPNYIVVRYLEKPYKRKIKDIECTIVDLKNLIEELKAIN